VDSQNIYLEIPSRVVIENTGRRITEAAVRSELVEHYSKVCGCRVAVEELILPHIEKWSPGSQWKLNLRGDRLRGMATVPVTVSAPSGEVSTYWIRTRLSHNVIVPVARRLIRPGDRVQLNDVEFKDQDITFMSDGVLTQDELIGRKARQVIAVNQIVGASMIEKEKAMKRGDQVKLIIDDANFNLVLFGVAESDGYIGDTVAVRNLKSQQKIGARITGKGEATVE